MKYSHFLLILLSTILSRQAYAQVQEWSLYVYSNPYNMRYEEINARSEERHAHFSRNYNAELSRLYGSLDKHGPFKFCASGGLGCNFMTKSSYHNAMKGHEEAIPEKIEAYRNKLQETSNQLSGEIENLKNGRDVEGDIAKKIVSKRISPKYKDLKDTLAGVKDKFWGKRANKLASETYSQAAAAELSKGGVTAQTGDAGNFQEAPEQDFQPIFVGRRWGYGSEYERNYNHILDKAEFLVETGYPRQAGILASMAGRYKSFQSGQKLPVQIVRDEAKANYPALEGMDQSNFYGYETVLIGNKVSSLQSTPENMVLVNIGMDRLSYLQDDTTQGKFLSVAEYMNLLYDSVSKHPATQFTGALVGGVVGVGTDAVDGVKQIVRHPIDSTKALMHAFLEHERTWENLKGIAISAYDDLASCDELTNECGNIVGRGVGELLLLLGTGSAGTAIKGSARVQKVVSALSHGGGKLTSRLVKRSKRLGLGVDDLESVFETGYDINPCRNAIACASDTFANADTMLKYADDVGLSGPEALGGIKDLGGAAKKFDIPNEKVNNFVRGLVNPPQKDHILFGELKPNGTWGGGHLYPGKPGKTVFPQNWSGDKILHEASDIVTDPKVNWTKQTGSGGDFTSTGKPARFKAEAVRDGVKIRVVVEPAGKGIVTAFPISGPGVIKNPM